MTRINLALLHHPVLNKQQELYTTSVTNIDVHDIARSSCTYGLNTYYIVTPILAQQELTNHIKDFWIEGSGQKRNQDRATAMKLISVNKNIQECIEQEYKLTNEKPIIIGTSAKLVGNNLINYSQGKEIIKQSKSCIILFGTGYGLAPEIINMCDYVLGPITSNNNLNYNHLSVRSAAAIILDRLFGA